MSIFFMKCYYNYSIDKFIRNKYKRCLKVLGITLSSLYLLDIITIPLTYINTLIKIEAKLIVQGDNDEGKIKNDLLSSKIIMYFLVTLLLSKQENYKKIITEDYINDIEKFSPLHDMGKVLIPDYILLKPGMLTKEEFEIMKKHAVFGAKVLKEAENNMSYGNRSFFLWE